MPFTEALRRPIVTFDDAKAWIAELVAQRLEFHLEDATDDIISARTGERIFTDEEAEIVRQRVARLYEFDWREYECPIGYMLDRIEARDGEPAVAPD